VLRALREAKSKSIVREVHFDEKWYHQTVPFRGRWPACAHLRGGHHDAQAVEEALLKAHAEVDSACRRTDGRNSPNQIWS